MHPSILGGSNHRHLRLKATNEIYTIVCPSDPFVQPKYPDIFRVNLPTEASKQTKEDTTPMDLKTDSPSITFAPLNVTQQKVKHDQALWLHLECQTIEKTLKKNSLFCF